MTRILSGLALFLILAMVETSFIASLPSVLALTPLVFALGVYLVQHQSVSAGAWWIAAFGFSLDALRLSAVPFETLPHAAAAAIIILSSRRIFSNRSLYGILACGLAGGAGLASVRGAILFFISLRHPEQVLWRPFLSAAGWEMLLMLILLVLLFSFAPKIRTILHTSFLLSRGHETF